MSVATITLTRSEALDAMMVCRAAGNDELADTIKRRLCGNPGYGVDTFATTAEELEAETVRGRPRRPPGRSPAEVVMTVPPFPLPLDEFLAMLESRRNDGFNGTSIGGSDIGAIMGLSPYASASSVYDRIVSNAPGRLQNAAMRRGVEREPLILARWLAEEESAGRLWIAEPNVPPQLLQLGDDGCWARASLDARLLRKFLGTKYVLEIKSLGAHNFNLLGSAGASHVHGIPASYYAQVQWYLMITGDEGAYFVVEGPVPESPLFVTVLRQNPEYIASMQASALAFWREAVLMRKRPTHNFRRSS